MNKDGLKELLLKTPKFVNNELIDSALAQVELLGETDAIAEFVAHLTSNRNILCFSLKQSDSYTVDYQGRTGKFVLNLTLIKDASIEEVYFALKPFDHISYHYNFR